MIPHLGALNMTAVDAGVLNGLHARLLASGNKTNRPGAAPGLSPRTVRYIHTIVHRMFKDAVRWGASSATRPTQPTHPGPRPRVARRS